MGARLALHGAGGRMGRAVVALLAGGEAPGLALAAALERSGHPVEGRDVAVLVGAAEPLGVKLSAALPAALETADVVVDFSLPPAASALFAACEERAVPVVSGTTGLDAAGQAVLERLALRAPVLLAPNFSLGVNVLLTLADQATRMLGPDYDAEIVEMHHRRKVDAPSGTALRLGEVVARARELAPEQALTHGRSGAVGARSRSEVGVLALRGGDVVGEHTLVLAGPGERLELTHRAQSRDLFARGALRAARWLVGRSPGSYTMTDILSG